VTIETAGLRERKREQTRRDLENAAVALVVEKGLDHATVDAISERANVSPRTFFNYFDTKEDAILGFHPDRLDEGLLAAHGERYSAAPALEAIVGLLVTVFGPAISDPQCGGARRAVIREYPMLFARQMERMLRFNEQLVPVVSGLLAERGDGGSGPAVAETALMTCMGAVRASMKQEKASDADLAEFERRAVALARKAWTYLS
jgi:AcrR family transcriptional regulator